MGAAATSSPAVVFATVDCGASWRSIALPSPIVAGDRYETAVAGIPGGSVIAFVSDGAGNVLSAFMTSDGGTNWRRMPFPTRLPGPEALSFVDAEHWWIVSAGAIYTSGNAGILWTHVRGSGAPEGWQLDIGQAMDAYHAWGILTSTSKSQVSRLAMTVDGGSHWSVVSAPQP